MNFPLSLRLVALMSILLCQIISLAAPCSAQTRAFTVTTMVRKHDPSPDGRTFFDCDNCAGYIPSQRAFNNNGDLVINTPTQLYCDPAGFMISSGGNTALTVGCQATEWGELRFDD